MEERLGKEYKLCSRKRIQSIFQEGKSIRSYPFACTYKKLTFDDSIPFQLVVSAPKRIFKKAHDRNYIKRLTKEAIRKNKLPLATFLEINQLQVDLFIVYTTKEVLDLNRLNTAINKLFNTLIHELEKSQLS
jgi:ribonuclease P protein component